MTAADALKQKIRSGAGAPHAGICTVAFSGGADSTALLLCLHEMREELCLTLSAVHVHHGIRGAEADRDAAFCRTLCERNGIPFQLLYVDAPGYAAKEKLSLETAARKLRYDALRQAAPEGEIATAHHAGDNAETVLFHLIRGSGMRGLCGIPPRTQDGRIIRPLLDADKAEILSYLREKGQDCPEDSTNAELSASRNRIRHLLMPLILQENPAALRHISRSAAMLSADDALLREYADKAFDACRDAVSGGMRGLMQYPQPVRMRVYLRMLAESETLLHAPHIDPDYEHLCAIDALNAAGDGKISLSADVYAEAYRGMLYISRTLPELQKTPMQIGENRLFPHRFCTASVTEADAISHNIHKSDTKSTLDFDMIKGQPYFRRIQSGDRMQLPGRDFSAELKKLVQACVPVPERRSLYVLFDEEGCIYCEGVGIAARVKPGAGTRRVLVLQTGTGEPRKQSTKETETKE
ncbi:MAG: tRNA lysidine(34) synthetase TilS [Oscillospiraceae bacterium]|nr:tRNA lysidine(34) synthetase TilS [Oscillospiraceae bacterium]